MNRGKKAAYNVMASITTQVVSLVCAFILPRLILTNFGSSYNGVVSSIQQFLSVVTLLRAGVIGATIAALYKPMANKDRDQISAIMLATEKYLRKISLIFGGFIILFSFFYPLLIQNEFDWLFTATLVLIISLSTFVQSFFGIAYQIPLQADQRNYIISLLEMGATLLNTIVAAILIHMGFGIHVVKLGSALVFCIPPLATNLYVKHHYKLRRGVKPDFSSISQRWDAFFHSAAVFVHNNTDIMMLTIFTNTKEISVYTVYYLVAHGLRNIISTISTGIDAAFGNMLAKKETEVLRQNLDLYELMIHLLASILFSAAFILITPFVQVYTKNITDVNYLRYTFGYLVIITELLYCLRGPYKSLIHAAGHFKQTKKYTFTEVIINLGLSIILVSRFGLVGVVIGTLVSIVYLDFTYANYACKHIVQRGMTRFFLRFAVTGLCVAVTALLSSLVPASEFTGYGAWIIYAVKITLIALAVTLGLNMAFYGRMIIALARKLLDIARSIARR